LLKEEVRKQITTPLGGPAFPKGPFKFNNREYLNIIYRTDLEALKRIVPEPLEVEEPFCLRLLLKPKDKQTIVEEHARASNE
jgi:acetoacetate decarboxylase